MKLVSDSGVGLTPELLHPKRTSRAVKGHAVATSASAMRERTLFLRLSSYRDGATPVHRRVLTTLQLVFYSCGADTGL